MEKNTDKAIVEQETIYVLFLHGGVPKLRYLIVENIKSVIAERVPQRLRIASERIGINSWFNVNRVSVNTGRKRGLGMLIKQNAPWLELVHCFNHRLELALKDAFDNSLFGKIDIMLTKLYYLYLKNPKRYHELKELSKAYNKTILKPLKAGDTCWVDYKYGARSLVLENYGAYISHLESLVQTESQALKRAQMVGHKKMDGHNICHKYGNLPQYLVAN